MKEYKDVKVSSYVVSLVKLFGSEVEDVHGYISNEDDELTFKLTKVILKDGTVFGCEGEHDFPYLTDFSKEQSKVMENVYKTYPFHMD